MEIFGFIILVLMSLLVLAAVLNRFLPKWFCDAMGWHLAPNIRGFDGCSMTGCCPRCGKDVMQDSQGNWF